MNMTPGQRDEFLFLEVDRVRDMPKDMKRVQEHINGNGEEGGLLLRVAWMEERVKKLVRSNNRLQAAIYVASGVYIAAKFYFDYLRPHP
jgi:hypothetical protein